MAKEARNGVTVKVHYTGTLDDGTVFDTSRDREPMEFTLGEGQLIPGFEEATLGLHEGESTKVHIESNDAYGPHRDELVAVVDRQQLPPDIPLEKGMMLQMQQPSGSPFVVTITDINDGTVTLDANHPLSGQDLNFDIELVEVEE